MATLWRYSEDERAAFENGYRAAIQDVLVMESASARRGKCLRQEVTPTMLTDDGRLIMDQ